ncbi:hypothetical protein ACIGPN_20010 [Streptomyces afghaniensis]|uniref:hypothetical protein n=1 Tax=Streptomyces afghaniensis TaxID=66865 RepID=UPI0037D592B0
MSIIATGSSTVVGLAGIWVGYRGMRLARESAEKVARVSAASQERMAKEALRQRRIEEAADRLLSALETGETPATAPDREWPSRLRWTACYSDRTAHLVDQWYKERNPDAIRYWAERLREQLQNEFNGEEGTASPLPLTPPRAPGQQPTDQ